MTNNTVISPVYPMLIQKYNTLIPDPNANVLDKINTIIDYLNQTGKLTNDVVNQWNQVMAWAMNDGLTTDLTNAINSGKFNQTLTNIFTPITGDLTTLQTIDKNTLVTAINDNVASLVDIVTVNNHTITYGYDSAGNVQTVTEKDASNNTIKTVNYTYDSVTGNVTQSVTVMNGKTVTTTYNYDSNNNITSTSNVIS